MTVLAHAAHWYHSVLYLAPVAIVVLVLAYQSWRDRRRGDDEPGGHAAGAARSPGAPIQRPDPVTAPSERTRADTGGT
jgi:hypothetical protein